MEAGFLNNFAKFVKTYGPEKNKTNEINNDQFLKNFELTHCHPCQKVETPSDRGRPERIIFPQSCKILQKRLGCK